MSCQIRQCEVDSQGKCAHTQTRKRLHTEVAERVLYQNQVLAAEAAAQRQFLEQALQMQDQLAYQQHLTWLTKVEADKAALNSELSKLVRAAELEKEAARLGDLSWSLKRRLWTSTRLLKRQRGP